MPGVNLDLTPASSVEFNSSACAQSGLEEVIGDLLAQGVPADKEERFVKQKFESLLRCAIEEIHMDLKTFGKQVDKRLEQAAGQVTHLAQTLARLQEENKCLRSKQEKLVREVQTLCHAMEIKDPLLQTILGPEVPFQSTTTSNLPFSYLPGFPQRPMFPSLHNTYTQVTESPISVTKESKTKEVSSAFNSPKESTLYRHDFNPASNEVNNGFNTSVGVHQESIFYVQDFDSAAKEFSSFSPIKSPPKEANIPLNSPKRVLQESTLYLHDFESALKEAESPLKFPKSVLQESILYPQDLKEVYSAPNTKIGVQQESILYPQHFEFPSKEVKSTLNSPKVVPQESISYPKDFDPPSKEGNGVFITTKGEPRESILYPEDLESPSKVTKCLFNLPIGVPQKSIFYPQDFESSSDEASSQLNSPMGVPQESILCSQDFDFALKEVNSALDTKICVPQESIFYPQDFELPSKDTNSPLNSPKGEPQESIFYPQDFECSSKDSNNPLNSPINAPDKSIMYLQDPNLAKTTRPKLAESSPAPHSPAFFSTRRSLSAPSLMGNVSCSTVDSCVNDSLNMECFIVVDNSAAS